jgi:hypothetical protein
VFGESWKRASLLGGSLQRAYASRNLLGALSSLCILAVGVRYLEDMLGITLLDSFTYARMQVLVTKA